MNGSDCHEINVYSIQNRIVSLSNVAILLQLTAMRKEKREIEFHHEKNAVIQSIIRDERFGSFFAQHSFGLMSIA